MGRLLDLEGVSSDDDDQVEIFLDFNNRICEKIEFLIGLDFTWVSCDLRG